MTKESRKPIYLKDYMPPDFLVREVFLHFELDEEKTLVTSILFVRRNPDSKNPKAPLVLDADELSLKEIKLDGVTLTEDHYQLTAHQLILPKIPDEFKLETVVEIKPQHNTRLNGLYKTSGNFCTQCESQGFRRITYYPDRPDVLSRFTTTIAADKQRYPVLLSNGNLTDTKELNENRRWIKWQDPSLKPSYLFALVAGKLDVLEDRFVTQSGKSVKLAIYVEPGKVDQAHHAMQALKQAMRWDEEAFGREYDLKDYMIVAVSDFNFGAMENKGLNIFNDKYILAKPDMATDDDYLGITAVIGHEYFHNWSGNRVTIANWFQITLKEGLTVFREQLFSGDMGSKAVKRIQDVRIIRTAQFAQDAGPMAHPIILDSYIEVSNFYTVTVYHKGAEVIRMLQTLLTPKTFRKAMDIYFTRNDGRAVTTEDFLKAMEDASDLDLTQFRRWYHQAGTPVLAISDDYDAKQAIYTLTVKQSCPPTPGQSHKDPFHIPLTMALFDPETGEEIALQLQGESESKNEKQRILHIKNPTETFKFVNIKRKPIPSLLRNFSAPVKYHYHYTPENLIFLMRHETDEFNRWDAAQQLAVNELLKLIKEYQEKKPFTSNQQFIQALQDVLQNKDKDIDKALIAEMLILPTESYLSELVDVIDVEAIHAAREYLKKEVAKGLKSPLRDYYQKSNLNQPYELTSEAIAQRRLKNVCLMYLTQGDSEFYQTSFQQFQKANNMTDTMGALMALNDADCPEREKALKEFYDRWQTESLVVDKWLGLQAASTLPGALDRVKALLKHPAFDSKNPNRVRALIGTFCNNNPIHFHDLSGNGYEFLTEQVLKAETFNPQLASRLLEPFTRWRRYDEKRRALMKAQLEKIAKVPSLSNDVYELVEKSLS